MCLAIPGRILEIQGDGPLSRVARVDFAGTVKLVNVSFVPEADVDDYVLVHVGVALGRIDEIEAIRVFDYLRELGEIEGVERTP